MKRLAFLLTLVSVTASMTGCQNGLLARLRGGNQCGSGCAAPALPSFGAGPAAPATCCPPAEYATPYSAQMMSAPVSSPIMMGAPAAPGCNCGAATTPALNGASFVGNQSFNPVLDGQMTGMQGPVMGPAMNGMSIDSLPMYGGNMMNGSIPDGTAFGPNIINDRIVKPAQLSAPSATVKLGQKQ